jgi:hypothetical protein
MTKTNITENGLRDLLTNTYKLDISDNDFHRLTSVLNNYNIPPDKVHIIVKDTLETFINDMHLYRKIHFSRNHTEIDFDDIIFELNPVTFGITESIIMNYPKSLKRTVTIDDPEVPGMKQNLVIIRTLAINVRDEALMDEHYVFVIYNEKMNTIAGIRFEQISD